MGGLTLVLLQLGFVIAFYVAGLSVVCKLLLDLVLWAWSLDLELRLECLASTVGLRLAAARAR